MSGLRQNTFILTALAGLITASTASADEPTCGQASVGIERRLRQLSLDLIGRPPTLEEYRFFQSKGAILAEDVRELMSREEFYTKMQGYHRALLRANISSSIYTEGDTRLQTTAAGFSPSAPEATRQLRSAGKSEPAATPSSRKTPATPTGKTRTSSRRSRRAEMQRASRSRYRSTTTRTTTIAS